MTACNQRLAFRLLSAALVFLLTVAVGAAAAGSGSDAAGAASAEDGSIKLSERIVLDAEPQTVWQVVGAFNNLSLWQPGVTSSILTQGKNNQPGAVRHVVLTNGSSVDEKLVAWNGAKMRYTYRIVKGSLPVKNYESTVAVQSQPDSRSALIWEGEFDSAKGHSDAQARQAMQKIYRAGLENVRTMVSVNNR